MAAESADQLVEEETKKEVKRKPLVKKANRPVKKPATTADTENTSENATKSDEKELDSPKKPTKRDVPKPWLKKKKAAAAAKPLDDVPIEIKAAENTVPIEEDPMPIPPAKGYNLDFLDNLDDPNFNPFATKTNIVDDVSKATPEKAKTPPKVVEDLPIREATPEKSSNISNVSESKSPQPIKESSFSIEKSADPSEEPSLSIEKPKETTLMDTEDLLTNPTSEQSTLTSNELPSAFETFEPTEKLSDNANTLDINEAESQSTSTKPFCLDLNEPENDQELFQDAKILDESVMAAGNLSLGMELAAAATDNPSTLTDDDLPGMIIL